jgi:hypothetical protein
MKVPFFLKKKKKQFEMRIQMYQLIVLKIDGILEEINFLIG